LKGESYPALRFFKTSNFLFINTVMFYELVQ